MAIREVRKIGDEILGKQCKEVKKMTIRTKILIGDMLDTMYEKMGVGLAAPQVGILKRIVVIDVGEGPIVLINPEIIEASGEQCGPEGCLSIPDYHGYVERPLRLKVRALDRDGNGITIESEGFLSVAICHETDHLNGILFKDKVIEPTEEQMRDYEARMQQEQPEEKPLPHGKRNKRVVRVPKEGE